MEPLAGQLQLVLGRQLSEILCLAVLPLHDGHGMSPLDTTPVPVVPIVPVLQDMKIPCLTAFLDRAFFDTRTYRR